MKVENTKRKFGETRNYVYVRINGYDALLTHDAAQVAIERAKRQKEDLPSRFQRLIAWFNGL